MTIRRVMRRRVVRRRVMRQRQVRVGLSWRGCRIGVHQCGVELRHRVQQRVLARDRDRVRRAYGQFPVDDDSDLGAQPVTDPAQPQFAHLLYAVDRQERRLRGVDEGRVDGVHDAPEDLAGGVPQHEQDGRRDQKSDDRVRRPPAERRATGTEQDGE